MHNAEWGEQRTWSRASREVILFGGYTCNLWAEQCNEWTTHVMSLPEYVKYRSVCLRIEAIKATTSGLTLETGSAAFDRLTDYLELRESLYNKFYGIGKAWYEKYVGDAGSGPTRSVEHPNGCDPGASPGGSTKGDV